METNLIYELIGYVASILVAVSLMMNAIVKLRIVNMIGALTFAIYGYLIGSIPVAAMNGFIVLINIYFLYKIYSDKDYFYLLRSDNESNYLNEFLTFYKEHIQKFQPEFQFDKHYNFTLFILSDMVPVGLLLGNVKNRKLLEVDLDFVIPDYRDFKIGSYLFEKNVDYFLEQGITKLVTAVGNSDHNHYLEKTGFTKNPSEPNHYGLTLKKSL